MLSQHLTVQAEALTPVLCHLCPVPRRVAWDLSLPHRAAALQGWAKVGSVWVTDA